MPTSTTRPPLAKNQQRQSDLRCCKAAAAARQLRAPAACEQRRLHGVLEAAAVDHDIGARPKGGAQPRGRVLGRVASRHVDHIVRLRVRKVSKSAWLNSRRQLTHPLASCDVKLSKLEVGDDHAVGAEHARRHQHHQADGPGSEHRHALPGRDAAAAHGVHANAQRLAEGALLVRPRRRQLVAPVGRVIDEGAQRAMVRRRRSEHDVRVEVVPALASLRALPAGHARLQRDACADAQRQHAAAELHDLAAAFVAEHHRRGDHKVADFASLEVVHVGAADADALHGNAHVAVRRRRGKRPRQELQLPHAGQHSRHVAGHPLARRLDSLPGV